MTFGTLRLFNKVARQGKSRWAAAGGLLVFSLLAIGIFYAMLPGELDSGGASSGKEPQGLGLSVAPFLMALTSISWVAVWVTRKLIRYQRRLRLSQQRLRGIVNSAMDAVVTTDSSGIILLFNQAAERIFDCTVGDALGKPLRNFIPSEIYPWKNATFSVDSGSEGYAGPEMPAEFRGRRSNGEMFPIEATLSRVEVQGETLHTLIMRDISERYSAEEEARRRNRLIKTITENATLALFMLDARNRCIFMNPSAEKMMGYSFDEMQGRSFYELLHEDGSGGVPYTPLDKRISTGLDLKKRMSGEDFLVRSNGSLFPVAFTSSPILEGSTTVGIVLEIRDITDRRNTETMLRERGERLQVALSASDTGTFRWNFHSDYIEGDGNLERLFGMREGKPIRPLHDFMERVHKSDRPALSRAMENCAQMGGDIDIEFRVVLPHGRIKWLYEKGKSFFDRDGSPAYMTGACVDITQRKSVEEELVLARQESEDNLAQLEAVVRSMSEGLIIASPNGELLFMNPSALNMFGITKSIRNFRRLDDFAEYLEISDIRGNPLPLSSWPLARAEKGESFSDYEASVRLRETERKWIASFSGNPVLDKSGETILAIVTVRDVTQEMETQEALRRQSNLTKTITDNASVGLLLVDEKGCPTFMNPAAINLLGYAPEEGLNSTLHQMVHFQKPDGSPYPASDCPIMKALTTGVRLKDHEDTFIKKDGGFLEVLCSLEPLVQDGKTTGAVLEFLDITARKRAEEALRESEGKLRQSQKMEAIGQLAGGIAHDFNNLLTAINGYSELALAMLDRKNPLYDNIREIRRAGERAAALTRQLLAYSRKQIVLPKTLNLNQVISNIHSMLRRLIPENIRIKQDLDRNLGLVRIDPNQLEQVLLNLALNARDAMPMGGALSFRTSSVRFDARKSVDGSELEPGDYVIMEVSDNGMGMPPDVSARIFEPFFTTKDVGKGTGLGLSSVYGIINQSGGAITVHSRVGEGTTFTLYFPRVEEEDPEPTKSDPEAPEVLLAKGEVILLAEDEDSVRQFTKRTLEKQGYQIIEARNGSEALSILKKRKEPIDALVSDVVMPGITGPELAKKVRDRQPEVKVLFMSGYTDEAILEGVIGSAYDFLQKPFSPAQLLQKLHDLLQAPKGKATRVA